MAVGALVAHVVGPQVLCYIATALGSGGSIIKVARRISGDALTLDVFLAMTQLVLWILR